MFRVIALCSRYCCQDHFHLLQKTPRPTTTLRTTTSGLGFILTIFWSTDLVKPSYSHFFIRDMCEKHGQHGGRRKVENTYMSREGNLEAYSYEADIKILSLSGGQMRGAHRQSSNPWEVHACHRWSFTGGGTTLPTVKCTILFVNEVHGYSLQSSIVLHLTTAVPYSQVGVTSV